MSQQLKARYRKNLTMRLNRFNNWQLITDMGQEYSMKIVASATSPYTDYIKGETLGTYAELRRTHQMDGVFKMWAMAFQPSIRLNLFNVFLKDLGLFNQDHDVAVAHDPINKTWLVLTERDFWIQVTDYREFELNVNDSLGSIQDEKVRKRFWNITDKIKLKQGETP